MDNYIFKNVYIKYLDYIDYKLKKQSRRSLVERFESKILPYFGDYNIKEIKASDYLNWQMEIYKNNYSNNYNSNLHYLMTNFFDFCILYELLDENVARKVGNFKKKNEKHSYNIYTNEEFKKFIKCVDDNVYKQFFNLMFYTGTRPGEAMALKFSDINGSFVSINKTIDEHGKREIGTPKNSSSIRTIKIDYKLKKDLHKLQKFYENKYMSKNTDFFVFGGNKPLSATTINRHKEKACKKANLHKIKLHEFRHSHATLLVSKKIMIKEVSRRLGHSNCNITLNIYTHATEEHEKRVINTLNFLRFF